jgi:hypothetical protein
VEGPPSLDGLPELFYGDSAHPVSARREVLAFKLPERSLIYTFHLSSGHYDHLRWVGHGVSLPSTLSIRNYWGQEAATLKTPDATSADLLAPPQAPLALPAQGILSVAKWLIEKGWLWALSIILFLRFQQPIADGWRKFLTTSSDTRRPGAINGKILWLTIVSMAAAWFALGVPGAVRFDVGDDPAMEMLASGYVTGHPSEYLVFVNVLIGFVLKALYLGIPIVPWYPLLLLATVIFCLAGITRLLLQEDIPDRFCWLSLFGIVFGTYFLMHLQFTSTAYLLGLLGMFIFSQRTSRRSLVLAVILIVLGSLIRFDSFLLLLITTAAATWFLSRRPWMDKAVFFAAILILSWSGRTFDHFYYDQQDDWRTYRQYNTLRGDLHSTPKLTFSDQNKTAYDHVGWSENDFNMFSHYWLYEDPATFGATQLAYLDQHLSSDRSRLSILFLILIAIILAPAPVFLFLVIILHKVENRKLSPLFWAIILGPLLVILAYLVMTARVPGRVVVPVLYAGSLFVLLAARENGETCRRLGSTHPLPLVFITLTIFSLSNLWINAGQNDRAAKRIENSLKYLTPYAHETFVSSIDAVQLERLNPLTALAETQNVNIIHLMWSGGSPSFERQLQNHGSSSLFQSLAFDPNFRLIIPTSQWERAKSFGLYMQEHYHQNIQMTPIMLQDGKAAVFPDFTVMKAVHDGQP